MRKLLLLIAAIGIAPLALATPPLRMDSPGVIQAAAVKGTDGGVHGGSGISTFRGGIRGFTIPVLAPPTPVITDNTVLDGGTTYTYAIAACSSATCAAGTESALGSTGSDVHGYSTLTSSYPITVTIPAVVGASAFAVWEVAPTGAKMGLKAVVAQAACSNAGDYCGATYLDTGTATIADLSPGLAGYGDAGPTIDLSATIQAGASIIGGLPSNQVSGVSGVAPVVPQFCEIVNVLVDQGTVPTNDAGFARTFNTAPASCSLTGWSADGGCIFGKPTIATTGVTAPLSKNTSCSETITCCGN